MARTVQGKTRKLQPQQKEFTPGKLKICIGSVCSGCQMLLAPNVFLRGGDNIHTRGVSNYRCQESSEREKADAFIKQQEITYKPSQHPGILSSFLLTSH